MGNETIFRVVNKNDENEFKRLNDIFNGKNTNSLDNIKDSLCNIDSESVFVGERNGKLIGFCCCQELKSICYDTCYFEIAELFVEEEYQKMGIGKGLIYFAENWYKQRNIFKVKLLTGNKNLNAQGFYEHLGYTKTDQILYKRWIGEI